MNAAHQPDYDSGLRRFISWLQSKPLLRPLAEGVLPPLRLLPDEKIDLEIRMANYRLQAVQYLANFCAVMLLVAATAAIATWVMDWPSVVYIAAAVVIGLSVVGILESWRHMLLHEQWRFILTNKRIIIITPDPKKHGLADAIYLKSGKIQVIDTNWSHSPLWGLFQATTGAKDVVLSLSGYEFKAEGAEVKGGLLFPDVMPQDIARLEELIFG